MVEVIGATRLRSWRERIESVTPACYPIAFVINFANRGPTCQPGLCRAPVWRCNNDDRIHERAEADIDLASGIAFGACRLPNDAGLTSKCWAAGPRK